MMWFFFSNMDYEQTVLHIVYTDIRLERESEKYMRLTRMVVYTRSIEFDEL